ncbi:MAG TPA: ASKHA domain-containing protein, partial [Streptosporangiaceae bacterium]|nr:ASKHA domain-containing protein [Streptosporangiaceae bacterium]
MTVTDEHAPGPVRINLLFNERAVRVPYGVTLFDAASWNGIAIDSTCGGHGTCKKCRIRIADDAPAPTSLDIRAYTAAELKDGWRLACRTPAIRDTTVEVPPLTTRPKAATVGVGRQVILRPAVQKRYLEMTEPDLSDQASDLERVLAQLDDLEPRAELAVLKTLGRTLREADYKVTAVVVDDVLIAVEPGDTTDRRFGIAFDLGTTTVVATLLDLGTGTPAAVASALNKQQPFGADVITRISATMMDPGALDKLQALAQETLAELAAAVCAEGEVEPAEVYEVALAGNATMTHIVLGIDPEPLGMAPFILATRLYPEVLAADLGLAVHPRARAVVFPSFGAYVGGDITAGLLASGMDRDARVRLFVDIGTNCEIVLGNREWLLATAAPAGPAFEGAAIRCGMRAADGAIEVVTMTPDELTLKVIGDAEPQGLCGSGLVDAVTGLVKLGLLDESGRFVTETEAASRAPGLAGRLTTIGKERVFVLHWRGAAEDSIYLSQRDVRE